MHAIAQMLEEISLSLSLSLSLVDPPFPWKNGPVAWKIAIVLTLYKKYIFFGHPLPSFREKGPGFVALKIKLINCNVLWNRNNDKVTFD